MRPVHRQHSCSSVSAPSSTPVLQGDVMDEETQDLKSTVSDLSECDSLNCSSSYKNHRAWSRGAVCFFCGSKGRPATEFVGADWRSITNHHVTPDEDCPHFDHCSENACPLHPNYAKFEEDRLTNKEAFSCRLRRATREVIASRLYGVLPDGGFQRRVQRTE